jgi:hypothetical protein
MSDLTDRCLAVFGALLIFTSATVGAISYAGPAAPSGQAEGVDLLLDGEKRALALGAGYGVGGIQAMEFVADNTVNRDNLIAAETNETKANIIQMWLTQRQNNEILMGTYGNYLNDTQSPATMIGMNEYVRQLNNESSEATARNEAKQAVLDYYATKEVQRNKQWEVTVESLKTAIAKAESSNVSEEDFLYAEVSNAPNTDPYWNDITADVDNVELLDPNSTTTITLVNGSQRTIAAPTLQITASPDELNGDTFTHQGKVHPYNGFIVKGSWGSCDAICAKNADTQIDSFKTKSVPSTSGARLIYTPDWKPMQNGIESQVSNLEARMDNIVNQTYSEYQTGEIATSDLVSPLQMARQYSPDNDGQYGTYTLAVMNSMGYAMPTNLSETRSMNVSVNGTLHTGVLLSDGLPAGGEFQVGTTYNSSNIAGEQYVQEDTGLYEIPENTSFTIEAVTAPDGSTLNVSKVGYTNPEYSTTSIENFKQRMEELRQMYEQINERQENMTAASGGGGGLDLGGIGSDLGLGNLSGLQVAALLALAGLAVLWYSNREEDGLDVNLNTYRDD